MTADNSTRSVERALVGAVKVYLGLRRDEVTTSELYEVFRFWHPAVTPDLVVQILREATQKYVHGEVSDRPDWNSSAGRLTFAGRLVKEFRRPAPNQRRILDAFQQVQWRRKIKNPFSLDRISFDIAAETLRNTAEALNDDHLTEGLLRFGTGDNYSSVYWKFERFGQLHLPG